MADQSGVHPPRRSRPQRVLIGLLMAMLSVGSAAVTAYMTRPPAAGLAMAVASDTSTLSPLYPGLPVPLPAPAPALTVSTGSCIDVPILVYHYIRVDANPDDPLGWSLSVTPREFQAQMDWLRAARGNTVTMAEVMDALRGGPALPPHAVVLTFDDGYRDFATAAAPILARDGFVGTDYVVSGFIGRPSYMSAQQILNVATMGMVIGAHTVNHVDLMDMSPQLAQIEISASKASLGALLGRPVDDFAYPYGDVDAPVAALVAQAGFRDAVTMNYGTMQCDSQRFLLRRIRVLGSDSVWSFAAKAGVAAPPNSWVDPEPPSGASPRLLRTATS